MKLMRIAAWLLALGVLLSTASLACAEEITLRDGQKIVGTIVGYEKDMFRVETDYGIALIRKDKVVSIEVGKPESTTHATLTPPAVARQPNVPKPKAEPVSPAPYSSTSAVHLIPVRPAVTANPPHSFQGPAVSPPQPSLSTPPPPTAANLSTSPPAPVVTPKAEEPAPIAAKPPAPPIPPKPVTPLPPPISHPIDVPLPAHLEDHLDGNTYFSDTFHFSMYKPPDWKIFEGVTKETGSGIMAMGTDDEQTVLIVDRQVWSGTPKLSSDEVEAKFRQTYQDYQQLSRERAQCAGQSATRTRFTGSLDGAEWHGVAVHLIRGNVVFGITGVTSAETFGFQEAIFNKIVNSIMFLTPAEPVSASSKP